VKQRLQRTVQDYALPSLLYCWGALRLANTELVVLALHAQAQSGSSGGANVTGHACA